MDEWVLVAVGLLVGLAASAGGVAIGVWALPRLRYEEQGYPMEQEIEDALLPIVFGAICAAFRVSEWCMDEVQERLRGANKKALADLVYGLLPEEVGGFPIGMVKRVVSEERFGELVQMAFDRFDRDFTAFEGRWREEFERWRATYGGIAPGDGGLSEAWDGGFEQGPEDGGFEQEPEFAGMAEPVSANDMRAG